jgi:hypothetical protein
MNAAFFTFRNIAVIAAFTLLFHIALNPIHTAIDGASGESE